MRRILLKLSGEALGGAEGRGYDSPTLRSIVSELDELVRRKIQVAIVIGGGNLFRGVQGLSDGLDRSVGDQMGMLATVMNALALGDFARQLSVPSKVMSAFPVGSFIEGFNVNRAISYLEGGMVVFLSGGTGNPFFTTDTAAALRAAEIGADLLIKATKVDGVYDRDPAKDTKAVRYDSLSYEEVLQKKLQVMDMTAFTLCQENKIPIRVVDLLSDRPIIRLTNGEQVGTLIS